MKRSNWFFITLFILFNFTLLSINRQSHGAIINVPADVSTIQGAIDSARSADTVKVAPGNFDEQVTMKDGVNLEGAGIEVTVISVIEGDFAVKGANSAILSGFTISNSNSVGILCDNVNTTIKNCKIIRCGNDGIRCEPAEPGEPEASPTIINNEITSNGDNGISDSSLSTTIKNNVIWFNLGGGIFVDEFTSPVIINNTIHANDGNGIQTSDASTPEIRNNIITSNDLGIRDNGMPSADFNDVFDNNDNALSLDPAPNDISEDPLFVDANNGDFRLQPGSPAIDAGDPDPSFNDPDGTRNDMGAFGGPGADVEAEDMDGTTTTTTPTTTTSPGTTTTTTTVPETTSTTSILTVEPEMAQKSLRFRDAVVTALDEDGEPVEGVTVNASATGRATSVSPAVGVTDSKGEAKFRFRFGVLSNNGEITFTADELTATIIQRQGILER